MLNYRTTQQNLRYALSMLTGSDYTDLEDEVEAGQGYLSSRRGPKPVLKSVGSLTEEYDVTAEIVGKWIDDGIAPETIGLLVPTRKETESLPRALGHRSVTVAFVDRDTAGPSATAQVMTMHRAKGMEFAKVILFGVGAKNLPRRYQIDNLPEGDQAEALQRERSCSTSPPPGHAMN